MAEKQKQLLIVDDHAVFRAGLALIIAQETDLILSGECDSSEAALEWVFKSPPDLVIIDISLGGMGGLELVRTLRGKDANLRLLVLSMHQESLYAERALRAGADGYIMKQQTRAELLKAIRCVLKGETYVSESIKQLIVENVKGGNVHNRSAVERLSNREFEVFQEIAVGASTREIAQKLHISMKTVEVHREHIRQKLQLDTTLQLMRFAFEWSVSGPK